MNLHLVERVGGTPLVEVDGVQVKMECTNPGGSVKDRIAVFMLSEALRRGDLQAGDTVVEATSGNTGIALALAARELGCRALVFMPEHMSEERVRMMRAAGAEVRLTPRAESFAGDASKMMPNEAHARRRSEFEAITVRWSPWDGGDTPVTLESAENGLFARLPQGWRLERYWPYHRSARDKHASRDVAGSWPRVNATLHMFG